MKSPAVNNGYPELTHGELSLLLALGEQLVAELDPANVLGLVADTACQVVQAETLVVPIIDGDRQTYTYQAASGEYATMIHGESFPIHEGACGWVLQHQRPLLFGEGASFELDTRAQWQPGMASSLLVPLICRGAIIGGLSALGKQEGGAFNAHDLTVLTLFANQASIAIDNARLFQSLGAEESRLRLVLESASEAIYGIDMNGLCTFANPACLRMLGYANEPELIGKHMHSTIHHSRTDGSPNPLAECKTHRSINDGRESHADNEVYWRSDGSSFPVEYWTHPQVLGGQIVGAVQTFIDITERKASADALEQLAYYDTLTQLPNRRLMLDRLGQALTSAARHQLHGALMLIDLDNFKVLNDTQGHDVGDQLLKEVAARLLSSTRQGDTVARLGGDEFVVILEDLDASAAAAMQAEYVAVKIQDQLRQPYLLDARKTGGNQISRHHHQCTSSIGITLFQDQSVPVDELMKRADTAMYQAKAAGRDTLRFFDPDMQAKVAARAAMEVDLRKAIVGGQLLLFYQPQVDAAGCVIGAEALVRWQHPELGLVGPAEFIPLAEETGLILPLGQWVLKTACTQLALWAARPETAHLSMAVNVSARQFSLPNLVDEVLSLVEYTGVPAGKLKLELTESLLLVNAEDVIAKMSGLKSHGVGFALDDFGTGYSSLSYLKRLPLDQLKIDQSFVRDVLSDSNDAAIARTIVALGQSLGLGVIAEGVETEAQRNFLADNGCLAYQGYLFSRPLPVAEFEDFLKRV
jgi:diguanylate cyclase (GGDEF)-like protein/PAS domain S-box-containing protein